MAGNILNLLNLDSNNESTNFIDSETKKPISKSELHNRCRVLYYSVNKFYEDLYNEEKRDTLLKQFRITEIMY